MRSFIQRVELDAEEVASVQAAFDSMRRTLYDADFTAFVDEVADRARQLPLRLAVTLAGFRRELGHAGALVVRAFPIPAALRPTPTQMSTSKVADTVGTEAPLIGCALMLGWPIGFADWHGGMRVQNLFPFAALRDAQCASNSVRLDFHTETAFRPTSPDGVMLLCLRPDLERRVETLLADLRIAMTSLCAEIQAEFSRPHFAFRLPDGRLTQPKPIISTGRGRERLDYAEALVGTTAAAENALTMLADSITNCSEAIRLTPGDLLVIDNRHMVHARSPIQAHYDGSDRWLQRVLLRSM
jgi:L-asparagine oxygenase